MELIVRYLNSIAPAIRPDDADPIEAYLSTDAVRSERQLRRLADNYARNYKRRMETYRQFVTPGDAEWHCLLGRLPGSARTPLEIVLRAEVMTMIGKAVVSLKPLDRELFLLRSVYGESLVHLAALYRMTETAIAQRLRRARERLREHLLETGWTEADLREGLAASTRGEASQGGSGTSLGRGMRTTEGSHRP